MGVALTLDPKSWRRKDHYLTLYRRAAVLAGEDPFNPSFAWAHMWLRTLIADNSLQFARRAALAIPTQCPGTGAVLRHPSTCDVLQYTPYAYGDAPLLPAHNVPHFERAEFYARQHFSPETALRYTRIAMRWEIYAGACGFDPLGYNPHHLAQFLTVLGRRYAASTVRKTLYAVRDYFQRARCPDITREPIVQNTLKALFRNYVGDGGLLLQADVRAMLTKLTDNPYDLRDGCMLLLVFFGGLSCSELILLQTSDFAISEHWVDVRIGHGVRIKRNTDATLDIGRWLQRWLTTIPVGPFAVVCHERGSWTKKPMCHDTVLAAFARTARLAGFSGKKVMLRLRRGFIHEAVPARGAIIVAHHLRRSLSAIEQQYPAERTKNRAYRRRARGVRDSNRNLT